MPATPIPTGSILFVGKNDPGDPESSLIAYLVTAETDGQETQWIEIANSPFGNDDHNGDMSRFLWVIRSLGQFHNLEVELEDGLVVDET